MKGMLRVMYEACRVQCNDKEQSSVRRNLAADFLSSLVSNFLARSAGPGMNPSAVSPARYLIRVGHELTHSCFVNEKQKPTTIQENLVEHNTVDNRHSALESRTIAIYIGLLFTLFTSNGCQNHVPPTFPSRRDPCRLRDDHDDRLCAESAEPPSSNVHS